jgi:hypothetical protein
MELAGGGNRWKEETSEQNESLITAYTQAVLQRSPIVEYVAFPSPNLLFPPSA